MLNYLQVHLFYTLPPTLLLLLLHWPLRTRWDTYKTAVLVAIAVLVTTPWDAWIIAQGAWDYPAGSVLGTTFGIPWEEFAFFIIQTTFTSTLHSLLSRPLLPSLSLPSGATSSLASGVVLLLVSAVCLVPTDNRQTLYLRALLYWVTPFLLLLIYTSGSFALASDRWRITVTSISLATAYLAWVDWVAMGEGAWWVESDVLIGYQPWKGMPAEELLFFAATNTLIVFGISACDHLQALFTLYPNLVCPSSGPSPPRSMPLAPPPLMALYRAPTSWPEQKQRDLKDAVRILECKSRSFWVASAAFPAPVRQDLIILYAFCRVTDDLIDKPPSDANSSPPQTGAQTIAKIEGYLDLLYGPDSRPKEARESTSSDGPSTSTTVVPPPCAQAGDFPLRSPPCPSQAEIDTYLSTNISPQAHAAFRLLAGITQRVPRYPFSDLLQGYSTDLRFSSNKDSSIIDTLDDLLLYGLHVAGSVAELIVHASWSAYPCSVPPSRSSRREILSSAREMGVALQLVNIARDLAEDARQGRCYIPQAWFKDDQLPTYQGTTVRPSLEHRKRLRAFNSEGTKKPSNKDFPWSTYSLPLLALAGTLAARARPGIALLPGEVRPGARAASEAYLLIGEELWDVWKGDVSVRRSVSGGKRLARVAREIWGRWG